MYKNYGDVNFFEYGVLVDDEHSDTQFNMLLCRPYDDEDDLYQYNEVNIDITDSWIDKKGVMSFIGMDEDKFNPVMFAIGCTEYYSWDNFGQSYAYDWTHMHKKDICRILRHHMIASDNLNIEW